MAVLEKKEDSKSTRSRSRIMQSHDFLQVNPKSVISGNRCLNQNVVEVNVGNDNSCLLPSQDLKAHLKLAASNWLANG
jgi:hypothetical protein